MCIVCQHPERDNYAGEDPAMVVGSRFLTLPGTAAEQRANYEAAKVRIESYESVWLCRKHLDNYRLVVEALERHHIAKWGNNV